jgi:hypothetical protein
MPLRTGIFELTKRKFQLNIFTKSKPLFLLSDKSAFPFVGKMNLKCDKKPYRSLNSRQVI